jgi:hypothetical protein
MVLVTHLRTQEAVDMFLEMYSDSQVIQLVPFASSAGHVVGDSLEDLYAMLDGALDSPA